MSDRDVLDDQGDRAVDALLDAIDDADYAWLVEQRGGPCRLTLVQPPPAPCDPACGWCGATYAGHARRIDRREARYRAIGRDQVLAHMAQVRADSWASCQGALARRDERLEA